MSWCQCQRRAVSPISSENVAVTFSVLSGIEKALIRCISTYIDLTKQSNTHRDRLPLLLVPVANILQILENAAVAFGVLWRIEKASIQCISTHIDLTKRSNTDRDRFTPPAGTCSRNTVFPGNLLPSCGFLKLI